MLVWVYIHNLLGAKPLDLDDPEPVKREGGIVNLNLDLKIGMVQKLIWLASLSFIGTGLWSQPV